MAGVVDVDGPIYVVISAGEFIPSLHFSWDQVGGRNQLAFTARKLVDRNALHAAVQFAMKLLHNLKFVVQYFLNNL